MPAFFDTNTNLSRTLALPEMATAIGDHALQLARAKHTPLPGNQSLAELLALPAFLDNFKYNLAKGAAAALAESDSRLEAIYFMDDLNPDAEMEDPHPLEATINLIMRVKTPSAALLSFIDALDRALTGYVRNLPSPLHSELQSLLNVILVTDADVALGKGFAPALAISAFRPVKVWQRE